MWASNHGNETVVRSLLSQNCHEIYTSPSTSSNHHRATPANSFTFGRKKCSPLHWAAYKGQLKVCHLLLAQKISPLEQDALGNTVLHQAAAGGSLEVTACILSQGADVPIYNSLIHRVILFYFDVVRVRT